MKTPFVELALAVAASSAFPPVLSPLKLEFPASRHALRIHEVIDNQVRSLRVRQVIGAFEAGERKGTYWGIRTDIAEYGLADALPCPLEKTLELAQTKTRLKRLDAVVQDRLINWGSAICDAAMRRWVEPTAHPPAGFPFARAGLG